MTGLVAGFVGGTLLVILVGSIVAPLTTELDIADIFSLTGLGWISLAGLIVGLVTGTSLAFGHSRPEATSEPAHETPEFAAVLDASARVTYYADQPGAPPWQVVAAADGATIQGIWLAESGLAADRNFLLMVIAHEHNAGSISKEQADAASHPLLHDVYRLDDGPNAHGYGVMVWLA